MTAPKPDESNPDFHELRSRYERVLLSTNTGFWDWDVVDDQFYACPRLLQQGGFPPNSTFAGRGDFMRRAPFHPEDRAKWQRAVKALFEGSDSRVAMELRVLLGEETRWYKLDGICLRKDGKVIRWTGSSTDITTRKRAEEALRVSEDRYSRAMLSADAGFWDWNVETGEYYTSPRFIEMLGFSPGTTFASRDDFHYKARYFPEDLERWRQDVNRLFAGSGSRLAMEVRVTVAGETRWHAMYGMCFRANGKVVRWTGSATDITERKRAEEALRASESRYARAMEGSDVGHWDWNIQTDELFVSERAREILALPPGPLPAKAADLMALVPMHPEDRDAMNPRLYSGIAKGTHEREYRVIPAPGQLRWLRARGKVFYDSHGTPLRMTGSVADITQPKLAAEELRERKEMLEVAQKSARAAPWEWRNGSDPASMTWTPELEAMFGLRPGEYDGTFTTWRKMLHPEDWPQLKVAIAHALATGDIDCEYRVVHPDGTVRWLNQKGRAFLDASGKPIRSVGFMFDVTERHKVEDDLRSRQEMLDLAQKAARAVAFEWRIGTGEGENRWSPDLEAMYGVAPGTYDGTYESWKKLVHPADWPAVKEALQHAHRTGEIASEYRVLRADGSVRWLQAKGRMFFDSAGKPVRMVGFNQDVTERKQAEEELRKMEQELRRAQRLESLGTLAGGIAHDFNNILGAILGFAELAMQRATRSALLRRDLDAIRTAGERGRALVDRILAFSRSGVAERVPVHVEAVVRETLDQLAGSLPRTVSIACQLRGGRAAMHGDSTQVHQVVMNLANNAVQAMPSGGAIHVSLELESVDVPRAGSVGMLSPREYLVLRVRDAGSGIRPDVLEHIFDPFFTTKEVGVGSGLGLSLVHGIVTSVGGAIDVATELGKGSTFSVYLPRSGDAPANVVDQSGPLPRGKGQRVLVVDDEAPLALLATETLQSLGYAPVPFTSGSAALAAFRANPQQFDAVLTDERMPGLSGSALIREVRGIREAIPVVLMSGYFQTESDVADVVIKKPLSTRDLATSIARALRA